MSAQARLRPPSPLPRLRHSLWFWTMGALSLIWISLSAVSYFTGLHEATEITDGQLASTAALVLNAHGRPATTQPRPTPAIKPLVPLVPPVANPYAPTLHAVLWEHGEVVWDPFNLADQIASPGRAGYSTTQAASGPRWRVLLVDDVPRQRRVAVLMDIEHQQDLGADIAEHLARPALIVLPLVALLLAWAIRRGIRPLERLSQDILVLNTWAGDTLTDPPRFAELASTVNAINQLVARLQQQVQRERRFASDVAHELRTPLTAIIWQTHLARATADASERNAALRQAENDALRAGRIIQQLVDLTRAQALEHSAQVAVDLNELAATVLAAHAQQAHSSRHQLVLHPTPPGQPRPVIASHPLVLELMLRNLIDNALRHTPAGTHVQVDSGISEDGVWLSVSDDGQKEGAISLPLTKTTNMGLGLTLVQRLADWQGIQFVRDRGQPPWSTRFMLRWPAPDWPPA